MNCTCEAEKTAIYVKGDVRTLSLWAGQKYEMRYRLSPPVLRSQGPLTGLVPVMNGRLQLRRHTFTFNNTGYFRVEVTPKFRSTYASEFTGRTVGIGSPDIDDLSISSGSFRVATPGRSDQMAIDIVNSSFLPCWITGAEWEAVYEPTARRI